MRVAAAGLALVMGFAPGAVPQGWAQAPARRQTVVVDPGHGGMDAGARGPEGTLEKTLALAMAQAIAAGLEADHRVLLTRTGDYQLDIPSRTAVANQAEAALFISIHAGGSFLHQAKGFNIFYFKELTAIPDAGPEPAGAAPGRVWDFLQQRHQTGSRHLAGLLEKHLGRGAVFPVNGVMAAPLLVLRGADMPAVLIEIGYLTHPLEEKRLQDPTVRRELSERICSAVKEFLAAPP